MRTTLLAFLFVILTMQQAGAQLCSGSLGDPIINISFGANNPGPLKPGVTNLTYTNTGCPNDGQYTITNSMRGCFGNSWYDMPNDHTGDAGGQFMLVNASLTPNDFYVDTVTGLCSNTSFEFAAWVANILKPSSCSGNGSKPNLTFQIETTNGTVLLKYQTGDIPTAGQIKWVQYGTYFTTPLGVNTVVLRITNNANGGCGNDLALDDITFRPCGPTVTTQARLLAASQLSICDTDATSITIDANSPAGFGGYTIQWQISIDAGASWKDIPGAQSPSFTRNPTKAGIYQYRAVVAETANFASVLCRYYSSITTITVNNLPPKSPLSALLGCTGSAFTFSAPSGNGYTYNWSGPNSFFANVQTPSLPNVSLSNAGLYIVKVNAAPGCGIIDSFQLVVFPGTIAKITGNALVCEGNSTQLMASGGSVYSWSPVAYLDNPNISNPTASPIDSMSYQVIATNQFGCKDSTTITLNVLKKPIVNAGPDKQVFEGQSVALEGNVSGQNLQYYWSPTTQMANANTLSPLVSPTDSITYTLYASNGNCPPVGDAVFVLVYKKLSIPNAFSPNGDQINDTWIIKGLDSYVDASIKVFNREGITVFQAKSSDKPWDGRYNGTLLSVGTYYYLIDLKNGQPLISGWVVLIR
jgi:gliding motility-associated-like protein